MAGTLTELAAIDPKMELIGRFTITIAASIIASQGITAEFAVREAFKIYDAAVELERQREKK